MSWPVHALAGEADLRMNRQRQAIDCIPDRDRATGIL